MESSRVISVQQEQWTTRGLCKGGLIEKRVMKQQRAGEGGVSEYYRKSRAKVWFNVLSTNNSLTLV